MERKCRNSRSGCAARVKDQVFHGLIPTGDGLGTESVPASGQARNLSLQTTLTTKKFKRDLQGRVSKLTWLTRAGVN